MYIQYINIQYSIVNLDSVLFLPFHFNPENHATTKSLFEGWLIAIYVIFKAVKSWLSIESYRQNSKLISIFSQGVISREYISNSSIFRAVWYWSGCTPGKGRPQFNGDRKWYGLQGCKSNLMPPQMITSLDNVTGIYSYSRWYLVGKVFHRPGL